MAKYVLPFLVLLIVAGKVNAQMAVTSTYLANPFRQLAFANSYKDTITLSATYLGETGGSGTDNLITLTQIGKLHGLNISRLQNALAFNVAGFAQRFYLPYQAVNQAVIAKVQPNALLKLKCIVYRFFTIDGTTNFFYVDKVKLE